ncbi:MAG: hypothetical protein SX243_12720 [Acidobacteriota bacterium]|nr:hypothetical protein [Acidobacteriota bacterium]
MEFPDPTSLTVPTPPPGKLVTADGGELTFAQGPLTVDFTLRFSSRDDEEAIDLVQSQLTLATPDGRRWVGEGSFGGAFAGEALLESETPPHAYFEQDAPPAWSTALKERCLIEGLRDLWDDRIHARPTISEREVFIPVKYQGPEIDVGVHRGAGRDLLVVRVRQLYDGDDAEILPPILYLLDPAKLVFRHTIEDDEGWLYDSGEEQAIVMRPVED